MILPMKSVMQIVTLLLFIVLGNEVIAQGSYDYGRADLVVEGDYNTVTTKYFDGNTSGGALRLSYMVNKSTDSGPFKLISYGGLAGYAYSSGTVVGASSLEVVQTQIPIMGLFRAYVSPVVYLQGELGLNITRVKAEEFGYLTVEDTGESVHPAYGVNLGFRFDSMAAGIGYQMSSWKDTDATVHNLNTFSIRIGYCL